MVASDKHLGSTLLSVFWGSLSLPQTGHFLTHFFFHNHSISYNSCHSTLLCSHSSLSILAKEKFKDDNKMSLKKKKTTQWPLLLTLDIFHTFPSFYKEFSKKSAPITISCHFILSCILSNIPSKSNMK